MKAVVSLMRSIWLFGLFHGSMWSICWNVGHSYVFITSQPDVTLGRLSVWWMIWESSEAEEQAVFEGILVRPFESFESLWPVLGCLSRTWRQPMFCPGLTLSTVRVAPCPLMAKDLPSYSTCCQVRRKQSPRGSRVECFIFFVCQPRGWWAVNEGRVMCCYLGVALVLSFHIERIWLFWWLLVCLGIIQRPHGVLGMFPGSH